MSISSKTFLNRPTMGPTLNDRFRELEYGCNGILWAIVWDPNNVMDVREWSICGGGRLERLYSSSIYIATHIQ